MQTLVLINEDFERMVLGKNTSLAYILAAVDLEHDVFVYKIAADGKDFTSQKLITALNLNKDNASQLVKKYKIENQKIVDILSGQNNQAFADILVGEFLIEQKIFLPQKNISSTEIDFAIQRLEPMKEPFPPAGEISVADFLLQLKNNFPAHFIFNLPLNSYADKELPLILSQHYQDLATPTATSFSGDLELPEKLQEIAKKYSEIFFTAKQKVVFKPNDSAQALGIFAVEVKNDGLNLAQLKTKTIAELMNTQLYEVNISKAPQDINEIIDILCFIQFCKTQNSEIQKITSEAIAKISPKEILVAIHSLYGKNILMQPFLEGVRLGDIRINLAKMSDENFKVVGAVFRKSISYDEKNFTTCLTTGASRAQAIDNYLSDAEMKNLAQKIQFILQQLNHNKDLRNKYENVTEIGCDFLIVGNSKDIYFGEANHHCPALIPFSEGLEKAKKSNFYNKINGLQVDYNGGLAIIKEIITQQITLQKSKALTVFA